MNTKQTFTRAEHSGCMFSICLVIHQDGLHDGEGGGAVSGGGRRVLVRWSQSEQDSAGQHRGGQTTRLGADGDWQ